MVMKKNDDKNKEKVKDEDNKESRDPIKEEKDENSKENNNDIEDTSNIEGNKDEEVLLLNPKVEIKELSFLSTSLSIDTHNEKSKDWFKLLNDQKASFKLNGKSLQISKTENPYSTERSYYIRNLDDASFSFTGFEDGDIITISIVDKVNKEKWPDVNIKYSVGGFGATFKVVK